MYTVDHEAWSTGMDEVPAVEQIARFDSQSVGSMTISLRHKPSKEDN